MRLIRVPSEQYLNMVKSVLSSHYSLVCCEVVQRTLVETLLPVSYAAATVETVVLCVSCVCVCGTNGSDTFFMLVLL